MRTQEGMISEQNRGETRWNLLEVFKTTAIQRNSMRMTILPSQRIMWIM